MIPISTSGTGILGTTLASAHIPSFTLLGKSVSSSLENATTSQDLVNSSVHICEVIGSSKFTEIRFTNVDLLRTGKVTFLPLGCARFADFCANLWRLDCFSHSITMEVWKPARWKTAKLHQNKHTLGSYHSHHISSRLSFDSGRWRH